MMASSKIKPRAANREDMSAHCASTRISLSSSLLMVHCKTVVLYSLNTLYEFGDARM